MGILKKMLGYIAFEQLFFLFKKQPISIYYHLVSDEKVDHIINLYDYKNSSQFEQDLLMLKKNYSISKQQDLIANTQKENTYMLSFDDGLSQTYNVIFPILQKNNIKAVFFINPNFIDNEEMFYKHKISLIVHAVNSYNNYSEIIIDLSTILGIAQSNSKKIITVIKSLKKSEISKINLLLDFFKIDTAEYLKKNNPYLTKSQIQEMIDAGHYFGGHTMTHPNLLNLPLEEQKEEILNSINWVKSNFNVEYSFFSFPFTDKNISKKLISDLIAIDNNIVLFGNSGIKKNNGDHIIQRFSVEKPHTTIIKTIVIAHLYTAVDKIFYKYKIKSFD